MTKRTSHYDLTQYEGSDVPKWIGAATDENPAADGTYNGDMYKIDLSLFEVSGKVTQLQDATAAIANNITNNYATKTELSETSGNIYDIIDASGTYLDGRINTLDAKIDTSGTYLTNLIQDTSGLKNFIDSSAITDADKIPWLSVDPLANNLITWADIKASIFGVIYPVGSIYISTTNTDPSGLFGGAWRKYAQGQTIIGDGSGTDAIGQIRTFAADATGGHYDSIVVSHSHTPIDTNALFYTTKGNFTTDFSPGFTRGGEFSLPVGPYQGFRRSSNPATAAAGTSGTNRNLSPYIVTYIWERIA